MTIHFIGLGVHDDDVLERIDNLAEDITQTLLGGYFDDPERDPDEDFPGGVYRVQLKDDCAQISRAGTGVELSIPDDCRHPSHGSAFGIEVRRVAELLITGAQIEHDRRR